MRHQQLLDDYLNYVGLNRTASTVDCHRTKIRPLLKYWDHLNPTDFTRAEFAEGASCIWPTAPTAHTR